MFLRFRFVVLAIILPCMVVSCDKGDDEDPYDVMIDFQDVVIPHGQYLNDAGGAGFFEEGIVQFRNFNSEGYWYGFAYSQMHDLTTFDYVTNEYSAYVLNDPQDNKFLVGYFAPWEDSSTEIIFTKPVKDLSFDVANNTLAALAMKGEDPNQYAKKFEEGDWFDLIIQMYDAGGRPFFVDENGNPQPGRIPLAENTRILDAWMNISLMGDGAISKIEFSLDSSDADPVWGLNTPTYFCIDNIKARTVK